MSGQVSKRTPGELLNIPAKEWNAIADAVNFGVSQSRGNGLLAQSVTVLVRNDAGEDLDRYDCASLGDPIFTLAADGSVDLLFTLVKADPAKIPAILTEPIAHDATNKRYGRVWIHGLAYAFVGPGSTTSKLGVPTPTNNRLTPGSGEIRLLGAPSATVETVLPVLLGSGSSSGTGLAKSPAGGIPARSGDVPGVATCNLAELWDDAGTVKIREKSPAESVAIRNTTSVAVSASKWIHWKTEGSYKIVDVDDCA